MDLELSERLEEGHAVVELRGELDISSAASLRERLLDILADHAHSLVLDLSRLVFIDSTGLSVLVAAERRAQELGGTLSLVGPQKIVARVLRVTSLDKHFPIFPTVGEAILADSENGPPVAAT
ncbi:MAG: STAS domain-containing protein [Candidatus Dormibacteraeota bacterium]|nr:STAS domain-containing protein [Candidatus Dormibacteraeota bacterium]